MKKTKYYYSHATQIRTLPVITDDSGEVLFVCERKSARYTRLPRITVASVYDDETNVLAFGYAICSPKDQFKKAEGRKLAYQRALEKPCKQIVGFKRNKLHELSRSYSKAIVNKLLIKKTKMFIDE